jgi:hypothetical protein
MLKQNWKRGSLTVETAALMPMILLVIFGSIYICFYVHNRAWLTAAAYESALSGSMEAIKKNGQPLETARMKSQELGSTGFFGAENLRTYTNTDSKKVEVGYDLDTISVYGGLRWHLSVKGSSKIIKPTTIIRTLKVANDTKEAIKGE